MASFGREEDAQAILKRRVAIGLGAVALAVTLAHFFQPPEAPPPAPRTVYLDQQTSALDRSRKDRDRAASSAAGVASSWNLNRSGRAFHGEAAAATFTDPEDGAGAMRPELREMVSSPDVVVRLFWTPDGDFVYHRGRGWLRYDGRRWTDVKVESLPDDVKRLYPHLCARDG